MWVKMPVWVGHSCPTPLTLLLVLIFRTKMEIEFKSVGQECPTHTSLPLLAAPSSLTL